MPFAVPVQRRMPHLLREDPLSGMVQIQTILCKGKILWNPIQYHLFLREHFAEEEADKGTAVHELPEESNWEVHEGCLEPYGNELGTCVFE